MVLTCANDPPAEAGFLFLASDHSTATGDKLFTLAPPRALRLENRKSLSLKARRV
jgi:hypothetical protein